MRIRSALATVLLTAAMTATGAATATAFDGHLHGDEDATCSPYFGSINCRSDDYDID
ncbi:hypothetical protein ACVV2G_01410 [Streptomyces ziwulingensis]